MFIRWKLSVMIIVLFTVRHLGTQVLLAKSSKEYLHLLHNYKKGSITEIID